MGADDQVDTITLEFVDEAAAWRNSLSAAQYQKSLAGHPKRRSEKANSMAPIPKDFLFINKDSSNLGRDAYEAFTVTSHVSRNHRKWLKSTRHQKLKSSEALLLNRKHARPLAQPSQFPGYGASDTIHPQALHALCIQEPMDDCVCHLQDPVRQYHRHMSNVPCRCCSTESSAAARGADRHEPRLHTFRGNADPFSAAALGIGPTESDAIACASGFLVFAAWPEEANSVFRARLGDFSNSHINLRDSIAHEAELHAVIAAGYSLKATSEHSGNNSLARSFKHKVRSIELLRKQLQNGSLVQTLTLLRLLISLDFHNGDYAAARVHMRGVRAMCQYDERTNASLRELLLISDVWTSMALLCKPAIDPKEYNPGCLPQQEWYYLMTAEQTAELVRPQKDLVVMRMLGPSLHTLLQASEEVIHSKAIVSMKGEPWAISRTVLWMSRRGSATTGGLMTQYVDEVDRAGSVSDTDDGLTHVLRACASLSLILHMNFHWMDLPINYDFSKTFPAIEPILRRCSKSISSTRPAIQHLFTWLLFLCAMGDDVFSARGDLDFSGWAAYMFQSSCNDMKVGEPKLAKAMLLAVAYEEDLMDEFLEVALLHPRTKPLEPLLPFSTWKKILNHYVAPS
jgi:hypothetical protein